MLGRQIGKEQVSQMVRFSSILVTFPTRHHQPHSNLIQVFDPEAIASIRKGPSPDFKESFDMGNDADTSRLSNVWLPEDKLPGFKEYAVGFFECCRKFQVERYAKLFLFLPPSISSALYPNFATQC